MNDKDQQIIQMLEAGCTFKEIQQELHVSPSRISRVKKENQIGKSSNETMVEPNTSSESSEISSDINENPIIPDMDGSSFGSKLPETVAKSSAELEFERQKHQDLQENEKRKRENEEETNRIRERELHLQEQQLQMQKKEAEKPKKLLLSRLIQLRDGYDIYGLKYNEVVSFLQEATQLKKDFHSQYFIDNTTFDGKIYETTIDSLINLFSKIKKELEKNPKNSIDLKYQLDLLMIRSKSYML